MKSEQAPTQQQSLPGRNILLVIADDLGRNLRIYGQEGIATPNIDRLAAQGTVFDYAYASTASCSGSRSTLYTGLHTHENGQYGLKLGYKLLHYFATFDGIESAPGLFNHLGYLTAIIGKVHVGPDHVYPWAKRYEKEGRDATFLRDSLRDCISRSRDEGRPFFATIGFTDPHRDMTRAGFGNRPEGYPEVEEVHYDPDTLTVPPFLTDLPEVRRELSEYYQAVSRMDAGLGMFLDELDRRGVAEDTLVVFLSDNGPPFVNSKATLYDAGVRLPMLARCPGKRAGTRSPNLVSWLDVLPTFLDWAGASHLNSPPPNAQDGVQQQPPAKTDEQPRNGIQHLVSKSGDYVPRRRGRSILPIMDAEEPLPAWDHVFGSHTFHETTSYYPTRFLRDRRYKYHRNVAWKLDFPFAGDLYGALSWEGIRNAPAPVRIGQRLLRDYVRRPPEQLFDLEADPDEVRDLAADPAHAHVLREMRARLERWQRDTGDPWLVRDGQSVRVLYNHLDAGLVLPDRFDFDVENPGNR